MIEAANYLSGPYATMMLADLGAEVIKVEPPKGDPFRRFGRPKTYASPRYTPTPAASIPAKCRRRSGVESVSGAVASELLRTNKTTPNTKDKSKWVPNRRSKNGSLSGP